MQVLKAMDGNSVRAGMASKPEKRLTKKTPQPGEGPTQMEPSQPSQPAKATAAAEKEKEKQKIFLAHAVDSSQSMSESEVASQISLQEISSSSSGPLEASELGQPSKKTTILKRPASVSSKKAPPKKKPAVAPQPAKADLKAFEIRPG